MRILLTTEQAGLDPKSIAASLRKAAEQAEARGKRIEAALSKLPEGHVITQRGATWRKQTIARDVFWTNGKRFLSGRQLLEELGDKTIAQHVGDHVVYGNPER